MQIITDKLTALGDEKYRAFQCRLIPSVPPETVIGVRSPDMKKLASETAKSDDAAAFLLELPHKYYDENILHAALINGIKDFDACMTAAETFLPYIDNWAVCDTLSPKAFKKDLAALLEHIKAWLASDKTYTVRFGIKELMTFYLTGDFQPEYLELVAGVKSEEYYVKMAAAWFFATALTNKYDQTLGYIQNRRLDKWTHNKAIQKAAESFRVPDERKAYLKTLKQK